MTLFESGGKLLRVADFCLNTRWPRLDPDTVFGTTSLEKYLDVDEDENVGSNLVRFAPRSFAGSFKVFRMVFEAVGFPQLPLEECLGRSSNRLFLFTVSVAVLIRWRRYIRRAGQSQGRIQ